MPTDSKGLLQQSLTHFGMLHHPSIKIDFLRE
jgi:hypothetical protein